MFIGEDADGSVTEIESRDAIFLEEDFPTKGEVTKDFQLYEMEDPGFSSTSHRVEEQEIILEAPGASMSDMSNNVNSNMQI